MDHESFRLDFIGVGAAKAATTWLAACLAAHSQICLPEQKELNYFCTTYHWWSKTVTYHDQGTEWLQRQFSGCRPGQLLGEISPNYLVDPTSPALIRSHNPEIKIIISYRNPVEGLYSHYFELHKRRPVPDTFEEFLTAYPDQLKYGLFYTHTMRFLGCFPLKSFHFIVYEDIVEDPVGVLRALYEFLGVSSSQMPSQALTRVNVRKTPRSTWVRDFVSNSTDLLNSNSMTKSIKRLLRSLGVHRVADRILAANMRPGESPPMAEATRSSLIALYADETRQLGKLLDRDLDHWNR